MDDHKMVKIYELTMVTCPIWTKLKGIIFNETTTPRLFLKCDALKKLNITKIEKNHLCFMQQHTTIYILGNIQMHKTT